MASKGNKAPKAAPAPEEEGVDADFDLNPEVLRQLMANGNVQLVEALQQSLSKMVGTSSGFIEGLPKPILRRLDHLKEIDGERAELEDRFREERRALEEKYNKLYTPLCDKRAKVVTGQEEVPENLSEEAKAEDAAAEGEEEVPAGVPDFWMCAIRNALEEGAINDKDAAVLHYLTDLRCETVEDEGEVEGFRLVFSFAENPYFEDSQLTKTYLLDQEDMMVQGVQGHDIKWKSGKDVTIKVMKKKPKSGSKSSGKPQTKTEPVESFFRWFTEVPEAPEDEEEMGDEEMEALQEAMQEDFEIAGMLKKVIPNATKWFTGEALQEYDDEEDDDSEDGDEGEEEGEDDDEEEEADEQEEAEEAAPAAKAGAKRGAKGEPKDSKEQPQECKQQ